MTVDRADRTRSGNGEVGVGIAQLAYSLCGAVTWMALLNVAWLLTTVLGGVVLGAGPATAAAYTLSRRRLRGDGIRFFHDFWEAYRLQWRTANLVFVPVVVVGISLVFTCTYVTDAHAPWPVQVIVAVATAIVVGVCGILGPMYAHYELPWHRTIVTASRFALVTPWAVIVVVALAAALAAATLIVPALFWFLTIGAWIHLDMALGLALFAVNDRRLEEEQSVSAG